MLESLGFSLDYELCQTRETEKKRIKSKKSLIATIKKMEDRFIYVERRKGRLVRDTGEPIFAGWTNHHENVGRFIEESGKVYVVGEGVINYKVFSVIQRSSPYKRQIAGGFYFIEKNPEIKYVAKEQLDKGFLCFKDWCDKEGSND